MDVNVSAARRKRNNGRSAAALRGATATNGAQEFNLHQLLDVLNAMQGGDFSVRLPGSHVGVAGKICDAFNTIVAANTAAVLPPPDPGLPRQPVGRSARGEGPLCSRSSLRNGAREAASK